MQASRVLVGLALASLVAASACNRSGEYLAIAGGGFVFNYRIGEATYGIALKPMRDLPDDSVITATFDNPAGAEPYVLSKQGPFNPIRIAFQTPALEGVVAHHPYRAVVVLTDAAGKELQRIEKTYESDLDQSILPERPLVIGPGYQPNLDESDTAFPPSIMAPASEIPPAPEPAPAPAPTP
jgi:hypothetical protein